MTGQPLSAIETFRSPVVSVKVGGTMKRAMTLSVLTLAILVVADPALAKDALLEAVDEILKEPTRLVGEWEQHQTVALVTVGAVGLFGAVIAIVHGVALGWSKLVSVVLGALVTLLTGIGNLYLDFDHRQYRSLASQGRYAISHAKSKLFQLGIVPADDIRSRDAVFEEIRRAANEVLVLPERYKERPRISDRETKGESKMHGWVISPAHAESGGAPDWIGRLPRDDSNFYFVGYADGRDYTEVRRISRERALEEAQTFLANQFDGAKQAAAASNESTAKYLVESAKVQSTYSTYDKAKGYYRFYTLLSLSRRVAGSDLRLYNAKSGLPASLDLEKSLQSATRTQDDYLAKRLLIYTREAERSQSVLSPEQYERFNEARNLRRDRKYPEATTRLLELVKARPDFYLGWFNLALVYDDSNNFAAARNAYQRAIALEKQQNIGDASVYNSYGYLLYRQKDFREANVNLQRALELSPDHPKARNTLAASRAALAALR